MHACPAYWILCQSFKVVEHIQLPTKYTDLDTGEEKFNLESWPMMMPHSIADFLFEQAGLDIPEAFRREYWEFNARHGEAWAVGVEPTSMPLGIYGDSAKVQTKFGVTNLIGIYFNIPIWKPQSVRASRFLVTVMPEHKTWKHFTLTVILRWVTWSLNALMDGKHPLSDPYGKPLSYRLAKFAGTAFKHKCVVTEIRGDWVWHKKVFRFWKCSWTGKKVCYWCRALSTSSNPADLYWKYEDNTWDANHFSTAEFLEERMPPTGLWFSYVLTCNIFLFDVESWPINLPDPIWFPSYTILLDYRFASGPFIGLSNFHPTLIRWCLMHVLNLGLMYVTNGSGMTLGWTA